MFRLLALLVIALITCAAVDADGPVKVFTVGPDGNPLAVQVAGQPASQPGATPQPPGQSGGEAKKEGESKEKKPEQPEPKVIRRGDRKNDNTDSEELKATVGDDGRVAFQFRNQPWDDLVQWLSDISDKPIDWLELPGDRVNLASPGRYTVAETQDLFNRHLLARGYTILALDGGMTITKTENVDPSMVPRVDLRQLAALAPHSFVRASLDVGWLSAEKLAQELVTMIGPTGRLTALTTTNRMEAMGPAVNIRQVADVLERERDAISREALAPEFKLRYLPAEDAKRMLEEFLGVEKKKAAPMTPQQMQMMQQMQQQQQGQPQPQKKVEISIVANTRQNSVIIRAPFDRIAIADEFLKRIDVPSSSLATLADIESRVQVFRLQTLDPEKLIEIISDMNILEPSTRIRVDQTNKALIVSGSPADRFIIGQLIERLDGSGRKFDVLQLQRLDATEVAESIAFLMGQDDKKEDDSSRRSRYYWGSYGNQEEETAETDEFRVAANARYRQVLLWANKHEMEQVESLLIKLGEIPPPGGSSRTVRVIDASATPETYEYLQRLQKQWNRMAPNELELPDATEFKDPIKADDTGADDAQSDGADDDSGDETKQDDAEGDQKEPAESAPKPAPADESTVASAGTPQQYQLTMMQPPAGELDVAPPDHQIRSAKDFDRAFRDGGRSEQKTEDSGKPAAKVRIEVDSSGNLILICPDTKALDQLEDMMLQIAPPKRPYQVFKIQHATAFWVKLNLEEYFEEQEESGSSTADSFYRWYWDMDGETDEGPTGLGKGNKLRFVEDPDTNTIVVSGATSEQLKTIAELIELWDVNEPVNKRKMRFTKLVQLNYGQAEKIAETVKEAYRDLLSSNDKSFGQGGGGGGQGQNAKGDKKDAQRNREGDGSGMVDSSNGNEGGGTDFSFKGKLSLGIDSVGNTLLISAEGESLMELVSGMIEQLDEAARPAGEIQVFQLSGDISGPSMQRALKAFGVNSTVIPNQNGKSQSNQGNGP